MIVLASSDSRMIQRWLGVLAGHGTVQVDSFARLRLLLEQRLPGILLLHTSLAGLDGLAGVAALKRGFPDCRILVMADVPSEHEGLAVLRARCEGYANAHMRGDMLSKAIEVIGLGEIWVGRRLFQRLLASFVDSAAEPSPLDALTKREREVALLVADGLSNQAVADRLGLKERTIKAHLTSVFRKTGIRDRTQLALRLAPRPAARQLNTA